MSDKKDEKAKSPFDGGIEDETIALSKDELDNILSEAAIVQDISGAEKTGQAAGAAGKAELGVEVATGPELVSGTELPAEEEFDISGEIEELTPADLESLEIEESELESYTKELEGELGEEFDISEVKESEKELEEIDTEGIALETGLEEELDIDSYLESAKADIDLETLDLTEPPVLGETEELEERKVHAEKAFREAGIEGIEEEPALAREEMPELVEETLGIEEIPTAETARPLEEEELISKGFGEKEVALTAEEEELLGKDFDIEAEGAEEEVVTVTGEELEKIEAGEALSEAAQAAEKTSIDSTLLNDISVILKYMDSLLEDLPEKKIKEFAKSKYFALYKQVFEKLNLV